MGAGGTHCLLPPPGPRHAGWHPSAVLLPAPKGAPRAARAWQGPITPGTAAETEPCPEHSPVAWPDPTLGWKIWSFPVWGPAGPCWGQQHPQGCPQGPTAQQHHHEPRQQGPAMPQWMQAASCITYPLPRALIPPPSPYSPFPTPWAPGMWGTHGEVPHAAQGGGLPTAGGLQQGSPITPPRGQQPRCPHTAPSLTRAGGPAPVDASTQGTHCCLPPTPWPRWGEHRPSPPCPSPGTCVSNVAGSSRESACSESSTKFLSNRVMGPSSLRGAGQGEGTLGPSRTGLEAGGIPD